MTTRTITTRNGIKKELNFPRSSLAFLTISTLLVLLLAGFDTLAQQRPMNSNYDDYYEGGDVIIYSECGFRGQERRLSVGDYREVKVLKFPNDAISSIRVPRGLEVTIYEDSKFRGAYARLDRDISCFDRSWNNEVSSLKVYRSKNNGYDYGHDNGYNDKPGYVGAPGINTKNVGYVAFADSELRKSTNKRWVLGNNRSFNAATEFKVINSDSTSIYLQSLVSNERIRIDLANNEVVYTAINGASQEFRIERKLAGIHAKPEKPKPIATYQEPNKNINGQCFNYRAYTDGEIGGIRFHTKEGFFQFNKNAHNGRICHNGPLTMEINKMSKATKVYVEIQGKQFRFAKNEKESLYLNNWYRKNIRLNVK
ncbi:MAG: hypothetical protein AAF197_02355 [Pseudomonadota bacterium]